MLYRKAVVLHETSADVSVAIVFIFMVNLIPTPKPYA